MPDQLFEDKPVKPMRRKRVRCEVWDTLAALFFPSGVAFSDQKRLGKLAETFRQKGASQRELVLRRDRYRAEWPARACTPEALAKHWDLFAEPTKAEKIKAAQRRRDDVRRVAYLKDREKVRQEIENHRKQCAKLGHDGGHPDRCWRCQWIKQHDWDQEGS